MVTIPKKEYEALKKTILLLTEEVRSLTEKISLLKNGRKNDTSGTPSSKDIGRPNKKNTRKPSGKKTGGQKGHKGINLKQSNHPDKVVDHIPNYCTTCANSLEGQPAVKEISRQEIIIPTIRVEYVEHQSYSKTCSHCGTKTKGQIPKNLKAPIQYGKNIEAVVSYLSTFQYLPYNRIKKMMKDLFHLPMSEGTIQNIIKRMKTKALPVYHEIRDRIQSEEVVGSDETGTRIDGSNEWFHVWQNQYMTFVAASPNRGYATIEKYFADGFPTTVYVSDCYASQLKVSAKRHQLCLAHLLRELKNFEDALKSDWSNKMKKLLQKAIQLKNSLTPNQYQSLPKEVTDIESEIDELLSIDYSSFHKKIKAFIKRLIKNRKSILTFLYYLYVPPDNNGSERAVRNVKVKNKVSGGFRCFQGAQNYAVLRSVVDTAVKNSNNVFDAFLAVAECGAE